MAINKRTAWMATFGVVLLAIAGYGLLQTRQDRGVAKEQPKVLSVPEGEAGKVGDVKVTDVALDLAKITVGAADDRMVEEKVLVTGTVRAGGDQLVKVTPRSSGRVVKVFAQVGDIVKVGQSLALLESIDLAKAQAEYRLANSKVSSARQALKRQMQLADSGQFGRPALEEARRRLLDADSARIKARGTVVSLEGQLAEAQSERDALKGKVVVAQAELDVAHARLQRAESLYTEELIAKQELERVRADRQKAQADLEASRTALAQGETRIQTSRSALTLAATELKLAEENLSISRETLDREEKLFKGKVATTREIVEAEGQVREAVLQVQAAEESVRLFGGVPGGGSTFELVAPITGKVQERTLTLGETIDPEHGAFVIVNLDQVWAELAVSARDIAIVHVGDPVELSSDAAPGRKFAGTILSFGTETSGSTQSVLVRTTLGNLGHMLRPGAFLKGAILTDTRHKRVTVPTGALQEHTGKPTLYVALPETGAFEVRHVTLGVEGDGWREISSGLKAGERVAVTGTFYLKSEALKSSLSDGCCAPTG